MVMVYHGLLYWVNRSFAVVANAKKNSVAFLYFVHTHAFIFIDMNIHTQRIRSCTHVYSMLTFYRTKKISRSHPISHTHDDDDTSKGKHKKCFHSQPPAKDSCLRRRQYLVIWVCRVKYFGDFNNWIPGKIITVKYKKANELVKVSSFEFSAPALCLQEEVNKACLFTF